MTEFKHTPGPWTLYGEPEAIRIEGPRTGKSHLVLVELVGGRRRGEGYSDLSEVVANAKLIAAAPELLECLSAYVKACEFQGIKLGPITGDAWAAINKATQ